MDMIPVASSAIEAVGYEPESRRMRIRFAGGNEYDFCGVPEQMRKLTRQVLTHGGETYADHCFQQLY